MTPLPKRKISRSLPVRSNPHGVYVIAVRFGTGLTLTTKTGFDLGHRLDKGKGVYPNCATIGLTREEAITAIREWDAFLELNSADKERKFLREFPRSTNMD